MERILGRCIRETECAYIIAEVTDDRLEVTLILEDFLTETREVLDNFSSNYNEDVLTQMENPLCDFDCLLEQFKRIVRILG